MIYLIAYLKNRWYLIIILVFNDNIIKYLIIDI